MNQISEQGDTPERELRERFARMRDEDAAQLPEFHGTALRSRHAAPVSSSRHLVRLAAAATVVLALGLWLIRPSPEDPLAAYVAIMDSTSMVTDSLLMVSEGTLPETVTVPDVFELTLPGEDPGYPDSIPAPGRNSQ
jgi:hypothetical protein